VGATCGTSCRCNARKRTSSTRRYPRERHQIAAVCEILVLLLELIVGSPMVMRLIYNGNGRDRRSLLPSSFLVLLIAIFINTTVFLFIFLLLSYCIISGPRSF